MKQLWTKEKEIELTSQSSADVVFVNRIGKNFGL
jgi:hypothetical protein